MAEPTMADLMLESARRDAAAWFALVDRVDIHDSILGFHAQQVIEKALKAALFGKGVLVPRTHDIARLLDALGDAAVTAPPHADALDMLNPYAVLARYGAPDTGTLDRPATQAWLQDVLAWAADLRAG